MILKGIQPLDLKQLERMADAIKSESERGVVLINATILDEVLKEAIESHLVEHKDVKKLTEGFNAPIGTFHSRILLSFAIGLIPEDEYKQLELIRKIRNEFAHNVEASFESKSVVSHCWSLAHSPLFANLQDSSPKDVYVMSAVLLNVVIQSRLPETSRQRLFYSRSSTKSTSHAE